MGRIEGRVREAGGSRVPVSGAVVLVVDAPADVRPGKIPATAPAFDPNAVHFVVRAETDADGRFALDGVPSGNVRVIVVAGGYARLERFAAAPSPKPVELYVEPEAAGTYRTEVAVARERPPHAPAYALDGQAARHYAGGGDDPLLVSLNLPGVARSPGGLGLLSLRGGNPTETGYYVDGHPVPRAFHVVPVAGVVSPPMVDRVELQPGSYGPGYASFSAGLVEVHSRAGRREGVHGQAHLDLFDVGLSLEGPVGPGAVHFGMRRSHVDTVLRGVEGITGPTGILLPSYWDYLGRFDLPLGGGHRLSVRALGAGDRLRGRGPEPVPGQTSNLFDFDAAFHRFDLEWSVGPRGSLTTLAPGRWRARVSPSLRLDSSRMEQQYLYRRDARVVSVRAEAATALREWLSLEIGADLVWEGWDRRERFVGYGGDIRDPDQLVFDEAYSGDQLRLGLWLGAAFEFGPWTLAPAVRVNLYAYAGREFVQPDPRVELRGMVHPKVELFARAGGFAIPVVASTAGPTSNLISNNGPLFGGVADVPDYLIAYFDPGIEGEPREGSAATSYAIQASTGVEAQLPWDLAVRGTVFWREVLPTEVTINYLGGSLVQTTSRRRSMGFELLLKRALGRRLDGWIGYTLLSARVQRSGDPWIPALFDQRHNFIALLSASLPRGFRIGLRFRVVSGNPREPVLAAEVLSGSTTWNYRPIRGTRGTEYQPVFHQLDLRVDKRWNLRRTAVSAYLDLQNVYDRRYPEVLVYSQDWSRQIGLLGLPIYPSLGVQVDF